MAADDPTVLSYFDSLLRESDKKLLSNGFWFNDNVIGFVFEYFTNERYAAFTSNVSFIAPGVTQFIKLAEGAELDMFLEPLELPARRLVFMAVNDNTAADVAGGSHWSLLMYDRQTDKFTHYDSSSGSNRRAGQQIARKVEPYLKANKKVTFEDAECPQQTNGSDCGVYVVCVLQHICDQLLLNNSQADLSSSVTPESVTRRRHELKLLIEQLGAQKKLTDSS